MATVKPTDGMVITENTTFQAGVYYLPKGVTVGADNVTLDGGGAVLIGSNREGKAVSIEGRKGVTVRNLNIRDYYHGIFAHNCSGLTVAKNQITSTAEIEPNTIFLNIWLAAKEALGGAIMLWNVQDSIVTENDVQHQMNGILTYDCSRLTVRANQANYNSGFGIHLNNTSDSVFEDNFADYCCRYEPRGERIGHMGADATGFLIINKSCRNKFLRNYARLGGDGFFLAGRNPEGDDVGCNDNLFEANDGSLSPNIAFEATFSRRNIFRNNYADRCNYGFWLGYSVENIIEDNRMVMNRQAGIAVEHGVGMQVRKNTFQANGHGVLIWTKYIDIFQTPGAETQTSRDWIIEENTFTRNGKGIRIGADQDHGIRSVPEEISGKPELRPRHHVIRKNDIQDNRIGIDLSNCDDTIIEGNILNRNVEANIRQDDAKDTKISDNLGSAGAYL